MSTNKNVNAENMNASDRLTNFRGVRRNTVSNKTFEGGRRPNFKGMRKNYKAVFLHRQEEAETKRHVKEGVTSRVHLVEAFSYLH